LIWLCIGIQRQALPVTTELQGVKCLIMISGRYAANRDEN